MSCFLDGLLQIYSVEDGGVVKLQCSNIILGSDRPIRLHGGLVLGVTFDKKIRSGRLHITTCHPQTLAGSLCCGTTIRILRDEVHARFSTSAKHGTCSSASGGKTLPRVWSH